MDANTTPPLFFRSVEKELAKQVLDLRAKLLVAECLITDAKEMFKAKSFQTVTLKKWHRRTNNWLKAK